MVLPSDLLVAAKSPRGRASDNTADWPKTSALGSPRDLVKISEHLYGTANA